MMPLRVRIQFTIVMVAGTLLFVWAARDIVTMDWAGLIGFTVLAIAAETLPVGLGSKRVATMGFAVNLGALWALGPAAAILVAGVSYVGAYIRFETPLHKVLHTQAMLVVCNALAGVVFFAAGGKVGLRPEDVPAQLLPLFLSMITQNLCNSVMLAITLGVSELRSPWEIWRERFLWATPRFWGLSPIGVAMALVYPILGSVGLALFFFPLIVARYAFKLFTDMEAAHSRVLGALLTAIDVRHPYTAGHSRRVHYYAKALGKHLGLPKDQQRLLEYCSKLHDVGKIGIPEVLLNKPTKLSDDEYETIKEHSELGARIVTELGFHETAPQIVRAVHERYQGGGYPLGLKGNEIPRLARIIAVVDAFDAMTVTVPYRSPRDIDAAVEELRRCAGWHFDPEVVEAFCELVTSDDRIRQVVDSPFPFGVMSRAEADLAGAARGVS